MDEALTKMKTSTFQQEEYEILSQQDHFLVVEKHSGEMEEVRLIGEFLECGCFISQVAPDNRCVHVRSVIDHLNAPGDPQRLSQAEVDYYLSRVADLDSQIQIHEQSALQQKARIDTWLETETAILERKRSYFLTVLEKWARDMGKSTQRLVAGTMHLRKQPVQIDIINEEKVLEDTRFRRIIPEQIKVDKRELRKIVQGTGEEPEGVEVTILPPKFSYKLSPEVI